MAKRFSVVLAVALLVVAVSASAAPDRAVKTMERPAVAFDRVLHMQKMMELQQRLSERAAGLPSAPALEVVVTAEEREGVNKASRIDEANKQKMRVGLAKDLSVEMGFSSDDIRPGRALLHPTFGALRGNADGGFLWSGTVKSAGATALRIHFIDFNLPDGAEMYVHAANGMAHGPYTGRGPNGTGDFWSNTIAGSEVSMQLTSGENGSPSFTIAGLGYMTDRFAMANTLAPSPQAANTKPCSFNADCTVDAACGTENAAVNTAKNAVAHILFISGAYYYICSGGLVADSDTSTNIPYFITANHCISSSSEASSLETFFFYTAPSCQSCPDPGAANTNGATIVSTNSRNSDYSLLRLSQNAPSGAAFLGWSSTAIANTNGVNLYRISHPKGAPQAYSEHVVNTTKGTCQSWPRGKWIYSTDVLGATEGGSSGSPVVNGAGQLVGQLSGGCGFNVNDVCDTASNSTVDGAFAAYYTTVAAYLGSGSGGGGCTDADGDGYCTTQGDCNDNNSAIYPGANDTKGKQGRDGVDNDCDGIIDG